MMAPAFSCPMDVHATKLPGNIPIAWSFAIRGLPPGTDMAIPDSILDRIRRGEADEQTAVELEASLKSLLPGTAGNDGFAGTPREDVLGR